MSTSTTPAAKEKETSASADKQFSNTLKLPKTAFPLRAGGTAYEEAWREKTTQELYAWQKANLQSPPFVLHDGPPYANGELHMGHALNKILKDVILRFNVLRGRQVHYVPGWDCHGLPIEAKALAELKKRPSDLTPTELRAASCVVAKREIEVQRKGFRELGIMADWSEEGTYRTLDHGYELRQLKLFASLLSSGLIYRRYRPVYWSPSSKSALAEAELEYNAQHVSRSVYVGFKLYLDEARRQAFGIDKGAELEALVWTTTPWTLPANMGIAYNPDLTYTILRAEGRFFLVAEDRAKELMKLLGGDVSVPEPKLDVKLPGTVLEGLTYTPVFSHSQPSTPTSKKGLYSFFPASYVKADTGTGLVHSAPGHGLDDYHSFLSYWSSKGEEITDIFSPVDADGCFDEAVRELVPSGSVPTAGDTGGNVDLVGLPVVTAGTDAVIRLLSSPNLARLVKEVKEVHKHPYDWRTKKPVIVRATKQWFANIESVKKNVEKAVEDVQFVPSNGKSRLSTYIRERSEWCISRQRSWGVPIPIIYNTATDEPLLDEGAVNYSLGILEERGVNAWFDEKANANEFLPPSLRQEGQYRKGMDTMDVWFDSGTSWTMLRDSPVGEARVAHHAEAPGSEMVNQYPAWADVALEGSDQHRGWFQSLMLTAVSPTQMQNGQGVGMVKPYHTVITHGFILDEKGRKMSKSEGNVVSPLSIIHGGKDLKKNPAYGTEVLRMWVATVEFWKDVSIGPTILAHVAESMRKIRNSARFMLGNLGDGCGYATNVPFDRSTLSLADRYIMHTLYNLEKNILQAYTTYNFPKVTSTLSNFANITLSSFYFDIIKDSLYADGVRDERRRATLFVLQKVLYVLTRATAPITPYMAEEIHAAVVGRNDSQAHSVFTSEWKELDLSWNDPKSERQMEILLGVRSTVLGLLEKARSDKLLKSSLEAEVDLIITGDEVGGEDVVTKALTEHEDLLKTLFIVSDTAIVDEGSTGSEVPKWLYSQPLDGQGVESALVVRVRPATKSKCPRCWTYTRDAKERLCERCEGVLGSSNVMLDV